MSNPYIELDDKDLCKLIKDNPENEMPLRELVERHSGIYFRFIHKYLSSEANIELKNDYLTEANLIIFEAAKKYDPNRGMKFSSFLGNETRFLCLNILNKQKREPETINSDSDEVKQIVDKSEPRDVKIQKVMSKFKAELETYPDVRAKELFRQRYFTEDTVKPWREIAPSMNLSIQGCINIHNSTLKKLSKSIRSSV